MTVALLLDLDETLIEEHSAAVAAFEATAAFAEASDHRLTDPAGLVAAARAQARELWSSAKATTPRPRRSGAGPRRTGVQRGRERWRRKVWTTVLLPTLLLNALPPNGVVDRASSQMLNLPFPSFESATSSGS